MNVKNKINIEKVLEKYSNRDTIWDQKDIWHYHVYLEIKEYLFKSLKKLNVDYDILILNAGSAGIEYNLDDFNHIHLDILEKNIKDKEKYIVSNIENIPIENNKIDMIICVGSVINYSDAIESIREFSRILKNNGHLILEFESSGSFEYLGTKDFNKSASLVKTFYQNEEEKIWIYSELYIKNILDAYNLNILHEYRFHILSGLIYRLIKNPDFATKFTYFDKVLLKSKILNKFATNIIITCKKN